MMCINKLSITNDAIIFYGFNLLNTRVTFCLYSGGIVILPGWQPSSLPCYYKSEINNDRKICDDFLIHILKDRGLSEDVFVQSENHYIELIPHRRPCIQSHHYVFSPVLLPDITPPNTQLGQGVLDKIKKERKFLSFQCILHKK